MKQPPLAAKYRTIIRRLGQIVAVAFGSYALGAVLFVLIGLGGLSLSNLKNKY